jgi:hypothetical protein
VIAAMHNNLSIRTYVQSMTEPVRSCRTAVTVPNNMAGKYDDVILFEI